MRIKDIKETLNKTAEELRDLVQLYKQMQSNQDNKTLELVSSSRSGTRQVRGLANTESLQETIERMQGREEILRKQIKELQKEKEFLMELSEGIVEEPRDDD